MPRAKITSKGQVTIPKAVRDELGIRPGDALEFTVENGHLEAHPVRKRSIEDFRGVFKPQSGMPRFTTWEEQREIAWRESTRRLWDPNFKHDEE